MALNHLIRASYTQIGAHRGWLLVTLLSAALAVPAFAANVPGSVSLVRDGQPASVIVYARADPLAAITARKLSVYLEEQTDAEVPIATEDEFRNEDPGTAVIVLDGTRDRRLAARFGQSLEITGRHADAYRLMAGAPDGDRPVIIAAGNDTAGAKYAAYRLMRELEIDGRSARVRPLDVSAEPFIRTRSVALFNVWGMPIELTRRLNTESWPIERLERYVDMYDWFGFNAIESHDRFNDNYLEPLFGLKRADWRAKVLRLCDRAHENGQQFFLRIWGHAVMQTPKITEPPGPNGSVPKRLTYLCVNDPVERKRWEEEIRDYYVQHYAGRIDHLIGHWCDPGVCRRNGCDFKTPLTLQMELHRAFKAVDPKFTSSFSLWFFDRTKNNPAPWARGGWPGYETDLDLINAGILARDVTIATATTKPNSYQDDVVRAIRARGHKAAVWTWYRADHEIRPSLHVHLHERLADYFRNLPPSARELAWHNIERNVHGAANTANYYVAGRVMWEPTLNVDELLKEFLAFAFGPRNADDVMPAYLAVEQIRCPVCYQNWERARLTGAGTADPRADLRVAQDALDRLGCVAIDPAFRPRVPLDVSPAEILADLKDSLEVIRDFARCRAEDFPAIERTIAAGDPPAANRRLDQLHERFNGWTHTLAGRQEWSVLDAWIKERRKQLAIRHGR